MEDKTTTILAYCGFFVSVLTAIVGAINHKRVRSQCCKKELVVSFDIEGTTPPLKSETATPPKG